MVQEGEFLRMLDQPFATLFKDDHQQEGDYDHLPDAPYSGCYMPRNLQIALSSLVSKSFPQQIDGQMVEQCGEPFLLPVLCCLPHTAQSLGHVCPALCRARARSGDVLLGLHPFLPDFRRRWLSLVPSVHRYYGAVRPLQAVHGRRTAFCLRGPVSVAGDPRRPGGLPVLVHVASRRAEVL